MNDDVSCSDKICFYERLDLLIPGFLQVEFIIVLQTLQKHLQFSYQLQPYV